MSGETFMDLYREGLATDADIDFWVDEWESNPLMEFQCSLEDYVGMTEAEFRIWCETGEIVG